MKGESLRVSEYVWCRRARKQDCEQLRGGGRTWRGGGKVGGAYQGLHNGSAGREMEAAQATLSLFPSGSRARRGMRADALLMLSSC